MSEPGGGAPFFDDCLQVRNGHLFVESCDAVELASRFGTPLYVVSEHQLRSNARRFVRAFETCWPEGPVNVLPSSKANYSLALRKILSLEGLGADTFGAGELHAALRADVPVELISVNGSVKEQELINLAVEAGARITLDSSAELHRVVVAARRFGRRPKVRFRVRPDYEDLLQCSEFHEEDVSIRDAAQEYKPGIPTEELLDLGRRALSTPEIEVTGIMAHLGRHHGDPEVWRGMVRGLVTLIAQLSSAWGGWRPREIDVGGGFPPARDPFGRRMRRHRYRGPSDRSPPIEAYAEAITTTLRDELGRHGLPAAGTTLEVEPGRSLLADTGIHLTTVRNIKSQTLPRAMRWVETDTTEMFLADGLIEQNGWTTLVGNKADRPPAYTATIVGQSCGFDVLVPSASLPVVERGDTIVFLDTGAYQDAAASNFNALPRPGTVLVSGDSAEIIKRPESIEDVFRRDQIPDRLAGDGLRVIRPGPPASVEIDDATVQP